LGAFGPGPYMATYVATKAFVLSFSESIAVELGGTGVDVLCVCPGFTRTEFQDKAEVDVSPVPAMAWMSADDVADQAVRAGGHRRVLVNGALNSATVRMTRFLPRGMVAGVVAGMLKPKEACPVCRSAAGARWSSSWSQSCSRGPAERTSRRSPRSRPR